MMGTVNTTLCSEPWRYGLTHWVTFELYPEWKGNTYYGFKGTAYHRNHYTTGTIVVLKTFRRHEGTVSDWISYKERCDVTRKMAASFNKILAKKTCKTKINVMKPTEVFMDCTSFIMIFTRILMRFDKSFGEDEVVLFEEYLNGDFKTFVSSTGLTTGSGSDILDAFCHFTYHESEGRLIVCNLKGIEEGGGYKLSNPTIHSRAGRYGDSDKRNEGIKTFFINHTCSALCKHFAKPTNIHAHYSFDKVKSKEFELTCEGIDTNEKRLLMCEKAVVSPPEYTLMDTFALPSYITSDNDT